MNQAKAEGMQAEAAGLQNAAPRQAEAPLLEVRKLVKHFPIYSGPLRAKPTGAVRAVDGVSFTLRKGETLGLVGESGCGKSTAGRLILRLIEPTAGEIFFDGQNLLKLNRRQMRLMRRDMQIVFQDPYGSLNPRMTVEKILGEPLSIHGYPRGKARSERIAELLEMVGLSPDHARRYPHEFSGGQRQRIGIARALAAGPRLVVCDEPVSALDVSIQAQIINLLQDLQERFGLAYLFIAHNLHVVRHISDRAAVMYLGKIVELADRSQLYENPLHPYTRALLSAAPEPDGRRRERILLQGDVPSPVSPPRGCRFHTRCPFAEPICKEIEPPLVDHGGRQAACHLVEGGAFVEKRKA